MVEMTTQHETFAKNVRSVLMNIEQVLILKNRKYGNSALEPKRIFSRADPVEQLRVRIDDKLSRVMSDQQDEDEDVELDLIGYLVLLQLARKAKIESDKDYDPT